MLVGCGANVAILDRDPALADRLMDAWDVGLDARSRLRRCAQARDVVKAEETSGRVRPRGHADQRRRGNNPAPPLAPISRFSIFLQEALRFVVDLNLLGRFCRARCLAGGWWSGRRGILNVSSMNAFRPLTRIPAYSAAKAAVSNFTQWLAVHMAQEYSPNIRVNAVAPGFFLTEQNRFLLTDEESGDLTPVGAPSSSTRRWDVWRPGGPAGHSALVALSCIGFCNGCGCAGRWGFLCL